MLFISVITMTSALMDPNDQGEKIVVWTDSGEIKEGNSKE